jgi:hypothetical protein
MSITGLFLVLLIASLFIVMTLHSQTGGSPSGWSAVTIPQTSNIYSQQFNELDNVDNVLKRPLFPANKFINALTPVEEGPENAAKLPKESMPAIVREPVADGTKVMVETKQPYFLDNALIVNYYGKTHYWDWRYPRQPLPVEFATDPEQFVRDHPEVYPSYVIKSRNYADLQMNVDANDEKLTNLNF